ncbi:MAG: electron transport complex subunit RsxE [Oscillospiraceae bacterium]|jgi:electron transport complex protein RnfE
MNILNQMKRGLLDENPTLVQLLGMCSTLAITTSLQNGIGMGISVTAVLICSNIAISLLRKITPGKIRIAVYVVVIAGFVTMVDLLLQAYAQALSESLGVFIPLIVVNCIILARAEAYASKNSVGKSAIDGLAMGLGYTLALCAMCVIREILGNGTIWGIRVMPGSFQPVLLLLMPVGGFLTLGCLIALTQYLLRRRGNNQT